MNKRVCKFVAAAGLMLSAMTVSVNVSAANYSAILSGAKEAPPNASPGLGVVVIDFDPSTHLLEINASFAGLLGETYAAHIHCCTAAPFTGIAGVMTQIPNLSGFPLGVHNGVYSHSYDTSQPLSWSPGFLSDFGGSTALAEAAFETALKSGTSYFNIHTSYASAGEVRGFFTPMAAVSPVPEPQSIAMLGVGLPALLMLARRRRKA
jgi:hypothetical protein